MLSVVTLHWQWFVFSFLHILSYELSVMVTPLNLSVDSLYIYSFIYLYKTQAVILKHRYQVYILSSFTNCKWTKDHENNIQMAVFSNISILILPCSLRMGKE